MKLTTVTFAGLVGLVSQVAAAPGDVKVMPFGASIVTGCWRAILYKRLQDSGTKNFDMVGSQVGGDCGFPYDKDNEGHPGAQITDMIKNNEIAPWLSAAKPDVILMHVGTNDVLLGKKPTQDIITAYSAAVDQMRASKSSMKIIISQLIPLDVAKFGQDAQNGIIALNKAMVQWAPTKSNGQSPITIVDNFTGFNTTTDTTDGEHPNDKGNQKFADKFFQPTQDAIRTVSQSG